ncbi:hypothetical protein [Actinophytocola sp.]|uniref:hypothetical protein n=1 Tax=Actinophytocola sp. TaxID=1872138 RepID=UPI002ED06387
MKWLVLYLRSRQVLVGAATAVACAAGITALASESMVTLFTVAVVTSVAATGLAGPDPALERTAALDWRPRRVAHVALIAVAAALLGTIGPATETEVLVRNAIGLTGLAALGVTVLGGGLAWCLPMVWTVVALSVSMAGRPPVAPLVTWPLQPPDTTAATVAAGGLGIGGLLVYAVRGPRTQ